MGTVHAKVESKVDPINSEEVGRKTDLSGVEARVDKINVEGLKRTKDDIIIETVKGLFQSTDFQEVIVNAHQVREKLEKLGCFQNIGIFIDTSSGKEATQNGLEVTFFVKELKRVIGGANTMVGNNEGSLVISLRAPNMFGRGERVQAEYSYGSCRTNNLRLSYIHPFWGPNEAIFTSSVFQDGSIWPPSGYKLIERGLLFDLGLNSTNLIKHNFQYEGVWREMGTSSRNSAFAVRQATGHKIKSAVRHILTFDSRDALIFPTMGNLLRLSTEYAGIGGDINFLKNEFNWQHNFSILEDFVFQTTFQAAHLIPLGNLPDAVGLPDKLYMGGALSVRGFETRGIGPHKDNNSIGSNFTWGGGFHLFTPLPFRPGKGGFGDLFKLHFFTNFGQSKELDLNRVFFEDLTPLDPDVSPMDVKIVKSSKNTRSSNLQKKHSSGVKSIFEGYRMSLGLGLALRLGQLARVEFNYVIPKVYQAEDIPFPGFQFGIGLQFL